MRSTAGKFCFLGAFIASILGFIRGAGGAEELITVYRDQWGVPHVYAETEEGACFGAGYTQAEDRPEELFKQYRRAAGRMAEVFGPEFIFHDYRQRVWRHEAVCREKYGELGPKCRGLIEAYLEGVKLYFQEHPERRPAWAMPLEPWQVAALGRFIIWGWPEGDAGEDLQRAGIQPDPVEKRGSNQWLVAPEKSAYGAPIALIDPHLSWYGEFRFYEARLYGGELQVSGVSVLGTPIPSLGHSRFCSIAMTTGGPDAADVYEETLDPSRPGEYLYDGSWRKLAIRKEEIRVKEGDGLRTIVREIPYSHHGPIIAQKNGKGYAMALTYFDQVGLMEQIYEMVTARNLSEMKKALGRLQLMEQNLMIGTVDGDIFYVRNGRVPIRPDGFDWKRPVPGQLSRSEWLGLHPLDDLVQILNPPQGYMQNCNVSPAVMMKGSPLTADRYRERPYLFNADMPYLHQRAAQTVEELHAVSKLTIEQAIAIANSTAVFNAGLWQERLDEAMEKHGEKVKADAEAQKVYELIYAWNRRADPDSAGATAYRYWKDAVYQIPDEVSEPLRLMDKKKFGEVALLADRGGLEPPPVRPEALAEAMLQAAKKLKEDWGRVVVAYGEVYRIGRKGSARTFPIGGGSIHGMSTPRAVGYKKNGAGKTYLGQGGQTSTQVVLLTRPPQSWSLLPLGESDDPASPHFDDQAEKLMARGQMKPTYFLQKEELLKHAAAKKELRRRR
ncbi:MAG: penicillin acylase family protein [Planctomycetes bacterium]|nr:penicillin acylase family protein [Planctomycetota bacterium]